MRIGITGSWRDKDVSTWGLRSDLHSFGVACHQLGVEIAQSGAAITVGSDTAFTADKYVVEGYLSNYSEALSVRVLRPQSEVEPFRQLYAKYPAAFVYLYGLSSSRRHGSEAVMLRDLVPVA
jgi:hypothetical protein